MNDRIDSHVTAEEGRVLVERGRMARDERRRSKGIKARVARLFADRPVWLVTLGIGAASVIALFALVIVVDAVVSFGRIHPGVRIGEVKVGAAKPESAVERIEERLVPRLSEPVVVVFEDDEWAIESEDIGASLDVDALVEDAMALGRTGPLLDRFGTRARLWFSPETVPVQVSVVETSVVGFINEIAEVVEREPQDAAIVIEGARARVEPAVLGVGLRREVLRDSLLSGFLSTDRFVEAEVELTPVRVSDEGVAEALAHTQAMLAGPVTVRYEDEVWEFSAADIATWIDFRVVPRVPSSVSGTAAVEPGATNSAVPDGAEAEQDESGDSAGESPAPSNADGGYVLEAFISAEKAEQGVLARTGSAGKKPVDARFKVGSGVVTIIPSEDGTEADVEALVTEMTRVLTTENVREVELKTRLLEPEITTAKAEAMGIRERISTYTTNYASGNRPRVNNIHTLSDALDGTLVPPGGVFSFNETIGPRTAAKGYEEAAAIVAGRLVPSLGGGICQVGTTIFNTVFESGLPVVERRNHSFYISTYPKGRDATVAWGGPDFKFKNDTDHWILIATGYTNSSVTVSLYGTDPGYTVTGTTGQFTGTVPFTEEITQDPAMPEGTRVVEDSGVDGRRIVVKRTVTKGGVVIREDTFTSVYRPKKQIVRVGTKVEESVVSTSTVSP